MIGRSSGVMQSKKVRGTLWLVAALPILLGLTLFDGNKSVIAVGMMFLIFGIVTLRQ